jgi:uncharacterized protein YaiE (UPF0345 family)
MFKTNTYFEGKVTSIAFQGEQLPATVGVMAPGEYTFATDKKETVTVISGELVVKLPESNDWNSYKAQDSFIVEANKSFDLKVAQDTAYLCTYE